MAFRGACFATKSSIFSLMSKMMTMTVRRLRATMNAPMNFLMIYQSSFLSPIIAVASTG